MAEQQVAKLQQELHAAQESLKAAEEAAAADRAKNSILEARVRELEAGVDDVPDPEPIDSSAPDYEKVRKRFFEMLKLVSDSVPAYDGTRSLFEWHGDLAALLDGFEFRRLLPPLDGRQPAKPYTTLERSWILLLLSASCTDTVKTYFKDKATGQKEGWAAWTNMLAKYGGAQIGQVVMAIRHFTTLQWDGHHGPDETPQQSFERFFQKKVELYNKIRQLAPQARLNDTFLALIVIGAIPVDAIPTGQITAQFFHELDSSELSNLISNYVAIRTDETTGEANIAASSRWSKSTASMQRGDDGGSRATLDCTLCLLRGRDAYARRHREADCEWFLADKAKGIDGSASEVFRSVREHGGRLAERPGGKRGKKWVKKGQTSANVAEWDDSSDTRPSSSSAHAANRSSGPLQKSEGHTSYFLESASSSKVEEGNESIAYWVERATDSSAEEHLAFLAKSGTRYSWVVDNAATDTICPDADVFYELRSHSSQVGGIGGGVDVVGIGKIRFMGRDNRLIEVNNVLYCPTATRALLSTGAFTRGGCNVAISGEDGKNNSLLSIHDRDGRLIISAPYSENRLNITFLDHRRAVSNLISATRPMAFLAAGSDLAHSRLGHCRLDPSLARNDTERKLFKAASKSRCVECEMGKFRALPHPLSSPTTEPLARIGADLWESPIRGRTGEWYMLTLVDFATRLRWVYPLKSKADATDTINSWLTFVTNQHSPRRVRSMRLDNGKEFKNRKLEAVLRSRGIEPEWTAEYNSVQNGMAERSHGILIADARTLLVHSGLSPSFWPYAIRHAAYLRNRLPSRANGGKSPLEVLTGRRPGLGHLRPFGCLVIGHIPLERRRDGKLNPRGFEGIFVGFDSETRNVHVYDTRQNKVVISANTLFHEELFPARRPRGLLPSLVDLSGTAEEREAFRARVERDLKPARKLGGQGTELPAAPSVLAPPVPGASSSLAPGTDRTDAGTRSAAGQGRLAARRNEDEDEDDEVDARGTLVAPGEGERTPSRQMTPSPFSSPLTPLPPSPSPVQRRSHMTAGLDRANVLPERTRGRMAAATTASDGSSSPTPPRTPSPSPFQAVRPPSQTPEFVIEIPVEGEGETQQAAIANLVEALAATATVEVPRSYASAVKGEHRSDWIKATEAEIKNLNDFQTWKLVDERSIPAGQRALNSHFVYAHKPPISPGDEPRFKARLVVNGNEQTKHVDYEVVFSPVADRTSFRAVLTEAAAQDYELASLDIQGAFLHGDIDRDVYVRLPEPLRSRFPGKVALLVKGLYGLRQAPRIFNKKLDRYLKEEMGWEVSPDDPCLYRYETPEGRLVASFHVDDAAIAGTPRSFLDTQVKKLDSAFPLRLNGDMVTHLGMQVVRDRPNRQLYLHQSHYAQSIIDRFGMTNAKAVARPADEKTQFPKATEEEHAAARHLEYRELIGSLHYLTLTRPDIAVVVGMLAQHNAKWATRHYEAAKRVLRYVKGTKSYGLVLGRGPSTFNSPVPLLDLVGVTDANWAEDRDDSKSISGWAAFFYSGVIAFKSKKQAAVATSSTDAEFYAACELGKHLAWLRAIVRFITFERPSSPTPFLIDNQSAQKLILRDSFSSLSKHIRVRADYVREAHVNGDIEIKYIPSGDNPADILTKNLSTGLFFRHRDALNIRECPGTA